MKRWFNQLILNMFSLKKTVFSAVFLIAVFCAAGTVFAQNCDEPVLYEPADMVDLRNKKEGGAYVAYADNKRLRAYETDRERYISLYKDVNQCGEAQALSEEAIVDAKDEMNALKVKWQWDDTSQIASSGASPAIPKDDGYEDEAVPVWEQVDPLTQAPPQVDDSEYFDLDIEHGSSIIQE